MSVSYSDSESAFIIKVKADLCVFVETASAYSVLVFPPVNSFFRFLIHQLAQENFDQLRTFSIGEDPFRRIVVCTKDLIERVDRAKDETALHVRGVEQTKTCAPESMMVVSNDEKPNCIQVRKPRAALPTIGIYRPPAARKSEEPIKSPSVAASAVAIDGSRKDTAKTTQQKARIRRPDQQVYVPRARRVEKPVDELESAQIHEKSPTNLILGEQKSSKRRSLSPNAVPTSLPSRASHLVETKKKLCQSTSLSELDWEVDESSIQSESDISSTMISSSQTINSLPPRAEVLVEKKKKLCQSNSTTGQNDLKVEENVCNVQSSETRKNPDEVTSIVCSSVVGETSSRTSLVSAVNDCLEVSNNASSSVIYNEVTEVKCNVTCDTLSSEISSHEQDTSNYLESNLKDVDKVANSSILTTSSSARQCNNEVDLSDDDYHDALSKNKSDCFTDMLDVSSGSNESLSSGDSVNLPVSPVQLMKPVKPDTSKKPSSSKCTRIFNPDECDWDALLDEDGEVLDPFLMKELTSAVGEVQISQPQSDYRSYRSQIPPDHQKTRKSLGDDDFNHVVEIYSFPKEFKTNDLVAVFSPFKNTAGGFEIKWVDDTHALGVFASALVAEQVLEYHHPMVRTRPLCDATLESRLKARRLSESIQSFRPRPETCAALARRLVTGALGVKLATAQQEREEEKRVLREAREKRRLAAKQRDDIWNNG